MAEKRCGTLLGSQDLKRRARDDRGPSTGRPRAATKAWTFRVSEIPSEVSKDQLVSFILETFSRNSTDDSITGKEPMLIRSSLAASPTDPGRYQVATVSFSSIPSSLSRCFEHNIAESFDVQIPGVPPFEIMIDSHFVGLTPLNDGPETCDVDLIFVTGLAGHAFGSWQASGNSKMWIRDILAEDLKYDLEGVPRILTYGYDSRLIDSNSKAGIPEFSRTFLEAMKNARRFPAVSISLEPDSSQT